MVVKYSKIMFNNIRLDQINTKAHTEKYTQNIYINLFAFYVLYFIILVLFIYM